MCSAAQVKLEQVLPYQLVSGSEFGTPIESTLLQLDVLYNKSTISVASAVSGLIESGSGLAALRQISALAQATELRMLGSTPALSVAEEQSTTADLDFEGTHCGNRRQIILLTMGSSCLHGSRHKDVVEQLARCTNIRAPVQRGSQ